MRFTELSEKEQLQVLRKIEARATNNMKMLQQAVAYREDLWAICEEYFKIRIRLKRHAVLKALDNGQIPLENYP